MSIGSLNYGYYTYNSDSIAQILMCIKIPKVGSE